MKLRNIGAGIAAAGLLIGFGASGAVANPVPDSGPTTGGTTVTLPAPEFRFTQVNAGGDVSAASGNNGQVYTWGSGGGALGDGTTNSSNVPVPVAAPAGVSLSLASSGAYGFANGSDLKTYAWAYDDTDDGDFNNFSLTPVPVHTGAAPAGTRFVQVSQADGGHAAAIGSDGDTYAWGEGGVGQLGDGLATTSFFPVRVQTPAGVHFTQVSVGHHFVIALGDDGKAYSWGSNDYGQLGDGTMTSRLVPVQVAQGAVPAGVRFVHVAAGDGFAAAVGDDGNVYTWGMNGNGQLGDGTMAGKTTPVKVLQGAIPAGVKILKVDATVSFAVALGDDGHAYAWGGENYHYFLGTDAFYQSLTPAQVQAGEVPAGVGFTDISVAFFSEERHTLAVGTNGKVYAWGSGG
ncbi:MAG TPA: hypothetical protein PKX56_02275, partial [Marmoricola sp.]|nr:hypothetical protein [Marmoricola sp.]